MRQDNDPLKEKKEKIDTSKTYVFKKNEISQMLHLNHS